MADAPIQAGRITVAELKGLNERNQNANTDLGEFDILRGCIPTNQNTLTRAHGCKLAYEYGEPILQIHQTGDSNGNLIVQTLSAVRVVTNFLNGRSDTGNLTPIPSTEEESMSRAVIVHQLAAGTNGGTYTTANTWQQAPLSAILEQLNPDGTAAAFVTFAANQFTLAAGVYRIRGYSIMSDASAATKLAARLYNITAAAPAWNGAANENSESVLSGGVNYNEKLWIGGSLNLAVPTILEIQGLSSGVQTNTGFGIFASAAGFTLAKELYRWIEVLKTA